MTDMALQAGELRHRVTVQSYVSGGRDDDGYNLPSQWLDFKKGICKR